MLLERSQMFRRHSVERDKVRFDPRLYLSSHLSFCSLQSLSIVRLLLSYPKFFRTRLVMVFPLASFLSFDEHRRSPFLPNDLDDRFVCFSLLLCSFTTSMLALLHPVAHFMYRTCCPLYPLSRPLRTLCLSVTIMQSRYMFPFGSHANCF